MTYFILTLLGFVLSVLIDIGSRNKKSKRTPVEFSWKFFYNDNVKRFLISGATSLCLVAIYHFTPFEWETLEQEALFALCVGFAPDLIISFLKRKFSFLK